MADDFHHIICSFELPAPARRELEEAGFTSIAGPIPVEDLAHLAAAYDDAFETAPPDDIKVGSSTTRVNDFVNRGPVFDSLYVHPPLLKACSQVINRPFRLSTMHGRTLRPGMPAQNLHVDFAPDDLGWTMVGFIFMVDEFRHDNGATRFIPGSHLWDNPPHIADLKADHADQTLACGPAGSMIVFNGSVWHGHTVNRTSSPRRSIQGAFIRREAESGFDQPGRMRPATLARISPLAQYVLGFSRLGATILGI